MSTEYGKFEHSTDIKPHIVPTIIRKPQVNHRFSTSAKELVAPSNVLVQSTKEIVCEDDVASAFSSFHKLEEERLKKYKAKRRLELLEKLLWRKLRILLLIYGKKRFNFWKSNMRFLKQRQMNFCARKIQTRIRVWLCRVSCKLSI